MKHASPIVLEGSDQAPRVSSSKELLGILEAQLKTRDWTNSKVLFNAETWKVKTSLDAVGWFFKIIVSLQVCSFSQFFLLINLAVCSDGPWALFSTCSLWNNKKNSHCLGLGHNHNVFTSARSPCARDAHRHRRSGLSNHPRGIYSTFTSILSLCVRFHTGRWDWNV